MSVSADSYEVAGDGPEVEIKIKASRFVGQALRAASEADARAHVLGIRKRLHDARHHCSAWRAGGPEAAVERSDDDGEPTATAGPPILEAIRRAGTWETVVVVTRWFGGTKLGKGGLIRAYDEAARLALEAAPRVTVWCDVTLTVELDYGDVGAVEAVIARLGSVVVNTERCFDASPRFVVAVRRSAADDLRAAVTEATAGRAVLRTEPAAGA